MLRKLGFPSLLVALALACASGAVHAQTVESGRHSRPRVTHGIDEHHVVTLKGNTHHDAKHENDRGKIHGDFRMEHMLLLLRRSDEQEQAVETFIDDLHNPDSPDFHRWLTAEQFGDKFGVSEQDLETLTHWLRTHGFHVHTVYPNGMVIDFSGTADQVSRAFGADIHNLDVKGKKHISNIKDPQIPAALAPVVMGVVSLNDFWPRSMHIMRSAPPKFTFSGLFGTTYAMTPSDLATIYNLNPLFAAGYSGQGQTIALIEDTDLFSTTDWRTFRSKFGLSQYTSGSLKTVHPAPPSGGNNCLKPGVVAPNDAEAILDAEWASAAAPSAAIQMVTCADTTTTFGGLIAVQNLINSSSQPPAVMSISYGECETVNGATANAAYRAAYQQAVAEGISVFVASGDSGAAGCDNSVSEATHGVGANALASTVYNVAVGGTDFSDTYSGTNGIYWNSSNTSTFGSAASYIPEIPWNDSCAGVLLSNYLGFGSPYAANGLCNDPTYGQFFQSTVAGGGSPSACATGTPSVAGVVSGTCQGWPKPTWQNVVGNANDGVRDTPDVSLFAADGLWSHYYIFCWSDTANGGTACSGDPSGWSGAGGTSFAAPILAGIQTLVNQKLNARQGNPNPVYYQLASAEYGPGGNPACNSSLGNGVASYCVFYDVTQGDMDVNCAGSNNCYNPAGATGVLSTSNTAYQPAYGTAIGWDFATGIGTLNATNLVANWPVNGPIPQFFLTASPSSVTMTQASTATTTITVNPENGFSSTVALTVSGLPSGVTASLNPTSTTSTSTLTFTASSTATVGTFNVTVTGTSGILTNSITVILSVNTVGTFTLSASPNSLSIFQASSGTSTITVGRQGGFSGNVNLSASGMPSGVTASFNPTSTSGTSVLTFTATNVATTGTFNINVSGSSGTLNASTSISLTILSAALPSGWLDVDIGPVGPAGSATYANGTFTVNGSGQYIWNNADGFNFAYQPVSNDFTIVARILTASGGAVGQSVGVMIRETLGSGSANAYALFGGGNAEIYLTDRPSTGGITSVAGNSSPVALPYWVKLIRSGSTFTSFASSDGVNWTQIATANITMANSVYAGLAVSSNDNSRLTTASFDNVSITLAPPSFSLSASPSSLSIAQGANGTTTITVSPQNGFSGSVDLSVSGLPSGVTPSFNPSSTAGTSTLTLTAGNSATVGASTITITGTSGGITKTTALNLTVTGGPLPNGWLDVDIGPVGPAGSATYSNGTFTVNGSGQYVYNNADGFNFAYQVVTGDIIIVARVLSASGGAPGQSVGVMIRETLSSGSTNAYALFGGGNAEIYLSDRSSTGGATGVAGNSSPVTLPYWVKLVRNFNTFTAFASTDGVNWTQVGTPQTIIMAGAVYAGLAVSSNDNTRLTTATFDNVSITLPPPSFTLSAAPTSIPQGASGTTTITVTPQNGFNGSVNLSATGLPSGVTVASFNPPSATTTSTLTLNVGTGVALGTYPITINGASGTLGASTTLSLTVVAPPSFTLSASPSSLSIAQGNNGTSTVTVNAQNNFSGTVNLSASGLPSGVTYSFNPTGTTTTSTLTLTAASNALIGTSTITVTGTSGTLTKTTTLTLTVTGGPLPIGWLDLDIGPVGPAGSATYSNGTFTVNGSGQYVWNTADGLNFAYQPVSGDFTIVARILSASGGAPGQSVGVMIRETLTATSANAYALFGGGNAEIYLTDRPSTTAATGIAGNSSPVALPYWVKLVRSGTTFTTFDSPDGVNWTQIGSASVAMAVNVYAGMAVSSNDNTLVTTAAFDNVSITVPPPNFSLSASPSSLSIAQGANVTTTITVSPQNGFSGSVDLSVSGLPSGVTTPGFNPASTTGTSTLTLTASNSAATGNSTITITGTSGSLTKTLSLPLTVVAPGLPSGWLDVDIGPVGPAGSGSASNGVFTVKGSGQYVWNTADGFNFAYQPVSTSSVTITARVMSASGGASGQSVGVMVRETLTAGSANAYALFGGGNAEIYLTDRLSTSAGTSVSGNSSTVALPYWVRLVRSGNTLSAFASPDGTNWTQIGPSLAITMANNVFVGLAVSSNNNSLVTTATFDNVSVTTP